MIHNGRESSAADSSKISDGESAALHLVRSDLLIARFLRELRHLRCQLDDVFLVHVADDRYQQSAIGVYSDADVDVLLVDNFFFPHVDRGVELRKYFQG